MTDQNYKELVELYGKYKSKDFEILAFPCNQFGAQESGSNEQIKAFAKNYGATFPLCLLYTSPSPRDLSTSRMPSSA